MRYRIFLFGLWSAIRLRRTMLLPFYRRIATGMLLLLSTALSYGASPKVANVWFEQRQGTNVVDIYYDLSDPDGDSKFTVTIKLSDDGGGTFTLTPTTVSGDIGKNVTSGVRKHITWDAAKDYDKLKGSNFVFKITADDGETPRIITDDALQTDMVLIPAGYVTMGSDGGDSDEKPVHQVYLDAYYIDKDEVTNEQYAKFLNEWGKDTDKNGNKMIYEYKWGVKKSGGRWKSAYGYENYPVVYVTWYGANQYAKWAGKRLPTEAEWEKAARGGLKGKKYPWGNSISHDDANYSGTGGKDRWSSTSPAGSFSPNGYGLYDMAGNVWEWCQDWYSSGYYKNSPERNPKGPSSGSYRVIRGGSWDFNPRNLRCADRDYFNPDGYWDVIGFRCARTL